MITECSVNFLPAALPCATTNECRKLMHQRTMQAVMASPNQWQSRKQEREITSAIRNKRSHRLMSLLATISKILIIAYTIAASSGGYGGPTIVSATASVGTASTVTWPPTFFHSEYIQCPSLADNPTCPCYKFDDGNYVNFKTK